MNQKDNALAAMRAWLSHENELGKEPSKLEIAGEFDLHDLHYYIFKFKKSLFSSWLVGVCGGYEKDGIGHCGHIFSEYQAYQSETAQQHCIEMVEKIREYLMKKAAEYEMPEARTTFVDFVLLKNSDVDIMQVFDYLSDHWQMKFDKFEKNDDQIYVTNVGETMISLALMNSSVPEGEAEYYAQGCYMWEDAVEEVKKQTAHIIVTTLGNGITPIEGKLIQSQLVDACMVLEQAIAVYGDQMVWPKHIYQSVMNDYLEEQTLPLFLWVYLGFVSNQDGNHVYTIGLRNFGHYELETLPSELPLSLVHEFIFNVVSYIVEGGAVLHDGETIGMTETQKCQITLSDAMFLEGQTLKIEVVEE